jgi:hypothetical protein
MRAWAITVEGFHENPFAVCGCLAETVEEAKTIAEKFFRERWRIEQGAPVDPDLSVEVYDDLGEHVATFTAYGRLDKVPVWE